MIKVVVERKSTGDTEEYIHHKKWVSVIAYAVAVVNAMVMVACLFSREFVLGLLCLLCSWIAFSKGRELERLNLLIEFVVDMTQALNEQNEKEDAK